MLRSCSLCVLLLLASAAAVAAGDCWSAGGPTGNNVLALYVDANNGNDSATGTQAAPFKTLTRALFGSVDNDMTKALFSGANSSDAATLGHYKGLDGRDVFVCLMTGSYTVEKLTAWPTVAQGMYVMGDLLVTWSNNATKYGPSSVTLQGADIRNTKVSLPSTRLSFWSVWSAITIADLSFEQANAVLVSRMDMYMSHSTIANVNTTGVSFGVSFNQPDRFDQYDYTWPFQPMRVNWTDVAIVVGSRVRPADDTHAWIPLGIQAAVVQGHLTNVYIEGMRSMPSDELASGIVFSMFEFPTTHAIAGVPTAAAWSSQSWLKISGLHVYDCDMDTVEDRSPLWFNGPFSSITLTDSSLRDVQLTTQQPNQGVVRFGASRSSIGQVTINGLTLASNSLQPAGPVVDTMRAILFIGAVNSTLVTATTFENNLIYSGVPFTIGGWKLTADALTFTRNTVYAAPMMPGRTTSRGTAMQVRNGEVLPDEMKLNNAVWSSLETTVTGVTFECNLLLPSEEPALSQTPHPIYVRLGQGPGYTTLHVPDDAAIRNCGISCVAGTAAISANASTNVAYSQFARQALLSCQPCIDATYAKVILVSQYPNVVSYGECVACPKGTHAMPEFSEHTSCPECEVGKFQEKSGQLQCMFCAPGTFQSLVGQTTCQQCSAGFESSTIGASSCTRCAGETYSAAGSARCIPCADGELADPLHLKCVPEGGGASPGAWIGISFAILGCAAVVWYVRRRRGGYGRLSGPSSSHDGLGLESGSGGATYQSYQDFD